LLALRGAKALDAASFTVTIVTGSGQQLPRMRWRRVWRSSSSRRWLPPSPRTVICWPCDALATCSQSGVSTRSPATGPRCSWSPRASGCRPGCTLTARRPGARAARSASGRCAQAGAYLSWLPFHDFQPAALRHAYVQIEQRLGRYTDLALCVGTGVAAEAVRRRLIAPDRVATIGVAVGSRETAAARKSTGTPEARRRARLALGLPPDVTVVGAVGRLTYQKAPEDFLTALQALGRLDR